MSGTSNIRFEDGTKLEEMQAVTYLGGTLITYAGSKQEVNNRIAATMGTMKTLEIFWKKDKV